jgi:hypothetical protein
VEGGELSGDSEGRMLCRKRSDGQPGVLRRFSRSGKHAGGSQTMRPAVPHPLVGSVKRESLGAQVIGV